MNDLLIVSAVFVSVLMLVMTVFALLRRQREVARNIATAERFSAPQSTPGARRIDAMLGSENEYVQNYFDVQQNDRPDSVRHRLIRAGYFSKSAPRTFALIRFAASVGAFVLVWYLARVLAPGTSNAAAMIIGAFASGVVFILSNFVLERLGLRKEREYRKIFPDFMDLLIVCVDAGLSIEAALDRVTREFLNTVPDFGVHLSIIGLEVRAGRPLYTAIAHFAERVGVEEARILSVLFRQSEELGTSISRTLRTFSAEMRQMRIVRAEEKANALPVKMLFPMALFIFPVNLIIVLVPIMMTILELFMTMSPG